MPNTAASLRHKTFHRKLEEILRKIDEEQGLESMITGILAEVGKDSLLEEAGITSGRLYRREGDDYVVIRSFGARGKEILGERVPSTYRAVSLIEPHAVTYVFADDEHVDEEIERRLGVRTFAAFSLGGRREYIAAFGIEDGSETNEVMLTLNALRHAIVHRLKELTLEGQLREARQIQISLLPKEMPDFKGFDIAGKSIPAELVGGDIFDVIELGENLLGVAIGDASGHGLPAALQARDAVTGLRMGVEKDLKITAVMRRLNHVIHRSGLTSRFISMLYGEFESNGNFVYVNAGHDPGLILRADGTTELLRSTGIVMGPLESAQYGRELAHLAPGDALLLYTDGIVERIDTDGEEFGRDRLAELAHSSFAELGDAAAVCDRILEYVKEWGGAAAWNDDVTLVAVRRLAKASE